MPELPAPFDVAQLRRRARSASANSSVAARRSSSNRAASADANGWYSRSANAGPRQSPRAWRRASAASSGSWAARPAPPFGHGAFEPPNVDCVLVHRHEVAGGTGDDPVGADRLPQLRHVALQRVRRARRSVLSPQRLGQPVGGDDLIGAQDEHGENGSKPFPIELDGVPAVDHPQRAQDPNSTVDTTRRRSSGTQG